MKGSDPAFGHSGSGYKVEGQTGMSIRTWMVGQVLASLSGLPWDPDYIAANDYEKSVAVSAVMYADAVLKALGESEGE